PVFGPERSERSELSIFAELNAEFAPQLGIRRLLPLHRPDRQPRRAGLRGIDGPSWLAADAGVGIFNCWPKPFAQPARGIRHGGFPPGNRAQRVWKGGMALL